MTAALAPTPHGQRVAALLQGALARRELPLADLLLLADVMEAAGIRVTVPARLFGDADAGAEASFRTKRKRCSSCRPGRGCRAPGALGHGPYVFMRALGREVLIGRLPTQPPPAVPKLDPRVLHD